jgi:hypothetical protein
MAVPGEWIWSSLSTTDPDANADFYLTLFDYEVFVQGSVMSRPLTVQNSSWIGAPSAYA